MRTAALRSNAMASAGDERRTVGGGRAAAAPAARKHMGGGQRAAAHESHGYPLGETKITRNKKVSGSWEGRAPRPSGERPKRLVSLGLCIFLFFFVGLFF